MAKIKEFIVGAPATHHFPERILFFPKDMASLPEDRPLLSWNNCFSSQG
jgi:hypothetical protein